VALVVSKLLNIVDPDKAYFGQKDWQQFAIISQLVRELNFNVHLRAISTMREKSGLAMSSRNLRLTESQKTKASVLYDCLTEAKRNLLEGRSLSEVKEKVTKQLNSDSELKLEYFELADSENLNLLSRVEDSTKPILCMAAFVGGIRLIDNIFLLDNKG
jgi:pantoate--beta-alanine ligase